MAVTEVASGTKTSYTGSGTEESLTSQTTAGVYVFEMDLDTLVDNDEYVVAIYLKTLSGGTARVWKRFPLVDDQGEECLWQSPPIIVSQFIEVKIAKVSSTDRSIPWKLMKT